MGLIVRLPGAAILALLGGANVAPAADAFSMRDASLQAVQTNPGEAVANRRETALRPGASILLPQVRLETRYGPEKFNDRDLEARIA